MDSERTGPSITLKLAPWFSKAERYMGVRHGAKPSRAIRTRIFVRRRPWPGIDYIIQKKGAEKIGVPYLPGPGAHRR